MSDMKADDARKMENTVEEHMDENFPDDDVNTIDKNGKGKEEECTNMPSSQAEEDVVKKKYGGIIPKKPPLISKDHERAFFDSADWALGKVRSQKVHWRPFGLNFSPPLTSKFVPGDHLMPVLMVKEVLLRIQAAMSNE
ncbi:uncharacterized protein LOC18437973 isoform X3 [Amborella trichopoda]|uniref:uncharacterized protein LOC18437973 isoform X3 n=1 Tax=Amborella trichopoda TaxID=13333 RepID=UPI0009BDC65D|nr:uncharacterized protein LOC18437973 isoform X3 [Amborella trichopoda]|eukprot:XP_020525354.1 uncharacterized protein LOC18437973 isoform X3 [Amborella trichopoda]